MHAYVYVEHGEGSGSGNRDFDSLELFMSYILKSLFMFMLYEAINPSSPKWLKIWNLVHNAGKLWQNFLKLCAEHYSHSY